MAISGKQPIGTMLVQAGKIDDEQLQKGLLAQREKEGYIGETFVELGYIDPKELNNYISHQLKIPFLQLGHYNIDSSLMDLFSEQLVALKIDPSMMNRYCNAQAEEMEFLIDD